jgi:ribose-phosphate pyrophosphokinase
MMGSALYLGLPFATKETENGRKEGRERMNLKIMSGRANPELAEGVAAALGVPLGECLVEEFPDGECQVEIREDVKGRDVYLLQPTAPPVEKHLLELLLMADASNRVGAARLTAVVPYFGYARQDRRERGTEAVGARVVADLLCARLDRLVTVDLHNPAVEGCFAIPFEHLSAVPLLAEALRSSSLEKAVLVAPDLGAAKLVQVYAKLLDLPVAYVHKERLSGRQSEVRHVSGEVRGRVPVVVDDMISTGGTIASAVEALLERGCLPEVQVVASHGLFVEDAPERFAALPVQRVMVTDSVCMRADPTFPLETIGLQKPLAEAVARLHTGSL